MDLIRGDRRSLEQRESYMAKNSCLGLAGSEIFSGHEAEVGSGSTEGKTVAFVVCSHTGKTRTARDLPFKVKYVG
ncbi:MAG TPA: hypothetical protein VN223_12250 [Candidatus Elarobacter sp.]|nr:hypothetical protein [Candidatus Elarobacter sp.]